MTIEELRALVQASRDSSQISWNGVVLTETLTGRLKQLNDSSATTIRFYNLALEQLNKQSPSLADALHLLSVAKGHETARGGDQTAQEALVGLTLYTEAPYRGSGFGSAYAAAVKV